jgi:hypothetical protein
MVDRAQWMRTAVEMGVYTRNEIRDYEGMDPIDGLDEILIPLNMTTPGESAAKAKEVSKNGLDEVVK